MKGFEMKGFEDLQKLGQQNMELTMKSVGELTKGWQTMAAEMGEYTKRSFEDGTQTFEKLSNARSFEQAVEIQSDFARRAYEEYMAQMSKIGNMYAEMAREAERLKAQELRRQALEVWNRDRAWRSGADGSLTPPATPPLIEWLEPDPTPETEPPAPQTAPPLVADDHTSTVTMRTVQLADGTSVRQVFVDGAWRDIT